jgi:hypothetical protein
MKSKLKRPGRAKKNINRYHSSEQGENSDEEEIFTIEKLLDKRYPGPKVQYLVKWKDYGDEHNSWEP